MIQFNVITNGRAGGKTWTIMHEMHDLILAGRRADVLVVFPNMSYLSWWRGMWEDLFPQIPMPRYISINNRERVRGLQVAKIYVEDIDTYENGIWDQRFYDIWPALRSAHNDEEVVFTSSWLDLNLRSHSRITKKSDVLRRLRNGDSFKDEINGR